MKKDKNMVSKKSADFWMPIKCAVSQVYEIYILVPVYICTSAYILLTCDTQCVYLVSIPEPVLYMKFYSKKISDAKKGEAKKVQVTERLKGVKSL